MARHPLAGLAATFSAVAAVFSVNLFVKPLDGILVSITNDAIRILNPGASISLTSNLWFSIASVFLLTIVVSLVNDKLIEPRLGPYAGGAQPESTGTSSEEARGLKYALWALIATLIVFGLLTLLPGAPLRNPETGAIIGDSPFMNGLIVFIALVFLAAGAAYGIGAVTLTSTADVIKAMEKSVAGLVASVAWSIFVALVLAPRVFPDNWFEHGLAEFGESQGNVATGFVMIDMVDPARQTDVVKGYSYRQV